MLDFEKFSYSLFQCALQNTYRFVLASFANDSHDVRRCRNEIFQFFFYKRIPFPYIKNVIQDKNKEQKVASRTYAYPTLWSLGQLVLTGLICIMPTSICWKRGKAPCLNTMLRCLFCNVIQFGYLCCSIEMGKVPRDFEVKGLYEFVDDYLPENHLPEDSPRRFPYLEDLSQENSLPQKNLHRDFPPLGEVPLQKNFSPESSLLG